MNEKIVSARVGFGTIFRILLIGNLILPLIFMAVVTLLSVFGVPLFKSGETHITGMKALLYGDCGQFGFKTLSRVRGFFLNGNMNSRLFQRDL